MRRRVVARQVVIEQFTQDRLSFQRLWSLGSGRRISLNSSSERIRETQTSQEQARGRVQA